MASETRRTRCEWPAVYGSRASTAALSVSIVSSSVASSSRVDSTRSCERAARSSFCARSRADAPRTRSARASQRTTEDEPDRDTRSSASPPRVVAVTTSSSSDTSAAPTTDPARLWSGAHTLTTGRCLPIGIDELRARGVRAYDRLQSRGSSGAARSDPVWRSRTRARPSRGVDVEPAHVVREPDRVPETSQRARRDGDRFPRDDGSARAPRPCTRPRRVRCRRARLGARSLGEPGRERDGADGEDRRRGEQERPEQRQGTRRARTSGMPACRRMRAVSARTRSTLSARVQSAAVDLDVVFLGTSGSMPTAKRALSATLVRRGGDRLLFDCAEGTQRQLLRSDVGLVELEEIFLTHYHADHYLGLPGMLKTFALRGREVPLTIYGPKGLDELLAHAAADLRPADVPGLGGRARARERAGARRLCDRAVRRGSRRDGDRLRARRGLRARGASTSMPPTGSAFPTAVSVAPSSAARA